MDQLGPQGFCTNITVQKPGGTNGDRNPAAAISGPADDPSLVVTTAPCLPQSASLLDGERTGAALLSSGAFLTLAGVLFTIMGWQHYLINPTFDWPQLLGRILISIGGTFILSSICRFKIFSFMCCRRQNEEGPVMEQTSSGLSFTFSGLNQQVMLCDTTRVLRIPPVYNFINQEIRQATERQPSGPVNDVHRITIPPPDSVYCVHNAAFTAEEEDSSAHSTETDHRRSRKGTAVAESN